MNCDKDGPCAPPCFTVTVIPVEETLEYMLRRSGGVLNVTLLTDRRKWKVDFPLVCKCSEHETLDKAIDQLCYALSGCSYRQLHTGKIIPGDIVSKIMASLPSTNQGV